MQMSGGRKTGCVPRTGAFNAHGPQEEKNGLCGKRPSSCEALACQAEGQEVASAASGSHGGGLSLGVAEPGDVGRLTGGAGSA